MIFAFSAGQVSLFQKINEELSRRSEVKRMRRSEAGTTSVAQMRLLTHTKGQNQSSTDGMKNISSLSLWKTTGDTRKADNLGRATEHPLDSDLGFVGYNPTVDISHPPGELSTVGRFGKDGNPAISIERGCCLLLLPPSQEFNEEMTCFVQSVDVTQLPVSAIAFDLHPIDPEVEPEDCRCPGCHVYFKIEKI